MGQIASGGRSGFTASRRGIAGLNAFACNLSRSFPCMANREKARFNLFSCKIFAMVACRQSGKRKGQGHQVQEFTILSLNVAWFGHTTFSEQLRGTGHSAETKNGPAEKPQARTGEGVFCVTQLLPGRRPMYCLMIASAAPVGFWVSVGLAPELPLATSASLAPVVDGSGRATSGGPWDSS